MQVGAVLNAPVVSPFLSVYPAVIVGIVAPYRTVGLEAVIRIGCCVMVMLPST